jgi:phage-related protein (TIGR01555 family)
MDRKYNRRNNAIKTNDNKITVVNDAQPVRTIDAFANALARLGANTPNLLEGTEYPIQRITRNYALMNSLYRNSWIIGKIIDTKAGDLIKNWFKLTCQVTPEMQDKFDKLVKKTRVKSKLLEALKWGDLYGGAGAVILLDGHEDILDQPLELDQVMPGSFKGLLVLDRWSGITPGVSLVTDVNDPEFGLPEMYDITTEDGSVFSVHHSRVLRFTGRELPRWEKIVEMHWGASEVERVFDELRKRDNTSWNIAQLIFLANLRVLKMSDFGQMLAGTTEQQQQRIYHMLESQNWLMNNMGMYVIDQEDDFDTKQYTFSGVNDIYESFMLDIAGAAEIPVTKLFGRAPAGLNATGESDLQNYEDMEAQRQEEKLSPVLDKLLPVLAIACWGAVPDDLDYEYNPISEMSDDKKAELTGKTVEAVNSTYQSGIIGRKTALKELRQLKDVTGAFSNITDQEINEADNTPISGDMGEMGQGLPGQGTPGQEEQDQDSIESRMQRLDEGVKRIDKINKKQGIISAFLEKTANMFSGQGETTDGGPGSGHFGHKGRPGFVGGSGKGGSSLSSGEKLERQGTAIAKGIETHTASGNESARQKLAGRLDGILEKLSGTSYNVQTKQREDPEEYLKPDYPEAEAMSNEKQSSIKEPWEMSKAEFKAYIDDLQNKKKTARYSYEQAEAEKELQRLLSNTNKKSSFTNEFGRKVTGSKSQAQMEVSSKNSVELAHLRQVNRALKEGKTVPEEVLKEYPALNQGQQKETAAASEPQQEQHPKFSEGVGEYTNVEQREQVTLEERNKQLINIAHGDPNLGSVQAARALLEKRGVNWQEHKPESKAPAPVETPKQEETPAIKGLSQRHLTPFTERDISRFNNLTHYPKDLAKENEKFKNNTLAIENDMASKLKKWGVNEIPADVREALNNLHESRYKFEQEWTRAREAAPPWTVTGRSNYRGNPDRAHAIERNANEMLEKAKYRVERAMKQYDPNRPISSDDPEAVTRLQSKIDEAQQLQEHMKRVNAAWRKGPEAMKKLGYSDEQIARIKAKLDGAYSWDKQPYPSYVITNNGANIRRMNQRIEELKKQNSKPVSGDIEFEGGTLSENTDLNRVQLKFNGKPSPDVIAELKHRGFHWSPTLGVWQRQRSEMAMYYAKQIAGVKDSDPIKLLDSHLSYLDSIRTGDGGAGSGNFGHKGRPGEVGGSGKGGGSSETPAPEEKTSEPVHPAFRGLPGKEKIGTKSDAPGVEGEEIKTEFDTPRVLKARREQAKMESTHHINTPERLELRRQLRDKLYELGGEVPKPGREPRLAVPGGGARKKEHKAWFIMGLPASGKSTIADPLVEEHGAMLIDADEAKKLIPEFGDGKFAGAVHQESSWINSKLFKKAASAGDNMILPLVGKNVNKVRILCELLQKRGYEVHLQLMELPPEEAARRALTRLEETDRFVDPDYVVNQVGLKPSKNYDILRSEGRFASYAKYSNDVPRGEKPKLLDEYTPERSG